MQSLHNSPEGHFKTNTRYTNLRNAFENDIHKITATSPMGRWIDMYIGNGYLIEPGLCQ